MLARANAGVAPMRAERCFRSTLLLWRNQGVVFQKLMCANALSYAPEFIFFAAPFGACDCSIIIQELDF